MYGLLSSTAASLWVRCGVWTPWPDSSNARMAHLDHQRRESSARAALLPSGRKDPQTHPQGAEVWTGGTQKPPGRFLAVRSGTRHKLFHCNSLGRLTEGRPLKGGSVCCPGYGQEQHGDAPYPDTSLPVRRGYDFCSESVRGCWG